jgi:hypothetical protein
MIRICNEEETVYLKLLPLHFPGYSDEKHKNIQREIGDITYLNVRYLSPNIVRFDVNYEGWLKKK